MPEPCGMIGMTSLCGDWLDWFCLACREFSYMVLHRSFPWWHWIRTNHTFILTLICASSSSEGLPGFFGGIFLFRVASTERGWRPELVQMKVGSSAQLREQEKVEKVQQRHCVIKTWCMGRVWKKSRYFSLFTYLSISLSLHLWCHSFRQTTVGQTLFWSKSRARPAGPQSKRQWCSPIFHHICMALEIFRLYCAWHQNTFVIARNTPSDLPLFMAWDVLATNNLPFPLGSFSLSSPSTL